MRTRFSGANALIRLCASPDRLAALEDRKGRLWGEHQAKFREVVDSNPESMTNCGCAQLRTSRARVRRSTPRGFEPLRAEPNGFLVHHLNHSVTVSWKRGIVQSRMTAEKMCSISGSSTSSESESYAQAVIAQLVARRSHNPKVVSSILTHRMLC